MHIRANVQRLASRPRRLGMLACLIPVLLLLLTTPSSSAPGDPVPGESELPDYTTIATGRGVVTNTQGTVVRRSKQYVTIRSETPIWGLLYTNLFNWPVEDPTSYLNLCSRGRPCIPDPFEQPACATPDDLSSQDRGGILRYLMYPVSPLKGGGVDVGLIARSPVRMVAFGSIPVTATLTLRSPRIDGRVEPFRILLWNVTAEGCDPTFADHAHAMVEGKVTISVSDLRVDGVPVNLNSSCRTVRPSELRLWNEGQIVDGGYSPGGGGNLGAYDGLQKGSLGPLESPFYVDYQGRTLPDSTGLTIPPFTGCTSNGDDLSPLITAMASGPNNPVRVRQGRVVTPDGGVDLNDLTRCWEPVGQAPLCPLPAPDTPERPPLPEGDE